MSWIFLHHKNFSSSRKSSTCLQDVFARRLQDVFKVCLQRRRLVNMSWKHHEDVMKMSWKTKKCFAEGSGSQIITCSCGIDGWWRWHIGLACITTRFQVVWKYSTKVLFWKILTKTTVLKLLQACNFIQKRVWHMHFPLNFAKFFSFFVTHLWTTTSEKNKGELKRVWK